MQRLRLKICNWTSLFFYLYIQEMPSSLLFALNTEGRIYALSTSGSVWREFLYLGLEFKRLSAVPHFLWAVGVDRQVYVHVHGLDVPIRVKEETYENERWLPLEGFSSRLLPTDRYHFSSVDGLVDRSIDQIRLPSMAWQWEGDWYIDTTLDGQPLEHDGWTYAVDFPAQFGPRKQWSSCVRRRKWCRRRRYSAMGAWCAVAPLHRDPTQEPFIDVCIGGTELEGAAPGTLLVWAVTAQGRVMFRSGVSATSPEGRRWTCVATPAGSEATRVSVGSTGLVWAALWSGRALARGGVTRDAPMGETWLEVKPPGEGLKITQVAVGSNSVWCLTSDKRVWFRKGISPGGGEEGAVGAGWVEMVGSMSQISVASNDQVWGIGSEDRCLYFRSGVSATDATGKKWRCVQAKLPMSRTQSMASLASNNSRRSVSGSPRDKKHHSLMQLNRTNTLGSTPEQHAAFSLQLNDLEETSHSAPTEHLLLHENVENQDKQKCQTNQQTNNVRKNNARPSSMVEEFSVTAKHFETQLKNPRAWSPVRSVGSMVGTEASADADVSVFDADSCDTNSYAGGVPGDEDDWASMCWGEGGVQETPACWDGVAAGACMVDPAHLPNWFMESSSSLPQVELTQQWRLDILNSLKQLNATVDSTDPKWEHYENAAEGGSWTKTGEARCCLKDDNMFADCLLELEWFGDSTLDSGSLTILNADGATTMIQISLSDVCCVWCCSEAGSPRIALQAPRSLGHGAPSNKHSPPPVVLQFSGDADMEDWLAYLTSVCCQMNEASGGSGPRSLWLTTRLGDVFNFDPEPLAKQQKFLAESLREQRLVPKSVESVKKDLVNMNINVNEALLKSEQEDGMIKPSEENKDTKETPTTDSNVTKGARRYAICVDLQAVDAPYEMDLNASFPVGTELSVHGNVLDESERFTVDLRCHEVVTIKHKAERQMRDIPFHLSVRFAEDILVLNSMRDNNWLEEVRYEDFPFFKGGDFTLNIKCEEKCFVISVDTKVFAKYVHRLPPESVSRLKIGGTVRLFKITYETNEIIVPMQEVFCRQMGGHLRRVEAAPGPKDATGPPLAWGVAYDRTPWIYTGGWGGHFLKGLEPGTGGAINPMSDTQTYFVYENQRWNPLSGFTAKGLPTDRYMWSDVTGKLKRSKEHTRLPSVRWQWVSDWLVDHQWSGCSDGTTLEMLTSGGGGVDSAGWRYAPDFPARRYHPQKSFADCVRRRRWCRRARLVSASGPWRELGGSGEVKVLDVTIRVNKKDDSIHIWAVSANGHALYRRGVTRSTPGIKVMGI
ncbi:tectonin beta-propeller repeat-containing protein-like [Ctenocephalides felis]|uniref:tectonin beta-propeller repeat-containing protein-like n=1 Tax=Ctenocephalides felis TaxID=7515 RepID=UPI000E6E339D|nr:tectonin beta-propeller repeat-containing protein-like [Ctenocephalides felis]